MDIESGQSTQSAGEVARSRRRRVAPAAKAAVRAVKARGFPVVQKDGCLKTRSVGRSTPQLYHNHVEQFEEFCVANTLSTRPIEADPVVDWSMETYFDVIFMEGAGVAKPRYTLWGWAFVHNRDVREVFPTGSASVAGLGASCT